MTKVAILCLGGCMALATMSSCSKGFDDDETFTSKVTGTQLASPELTKANFTTVVNADGSESIQVKWDVVEGAGGYSYKVDNVDGAEPVPVVKETNTDKCFFLFPKAEDTKYQITVQTLANDKLHNTAPEKATVFAYSTMIEAQVIPAGEDIVAFVKANIKDTEDEQAFELAGANYEINEEIDFGQHKVTFRGNKLNHPIVKFGVDGVIRTGAGLKIKWIKFDCTDQSDKGGVVELTNDPTDAQKAESDKAYHLVDPVIIEDCWFKNVKGSLFYTGSYPWAVEDVRVVNCIVQLNSDGGNTPGFGYGDAAIICAINNKAVYPKGGTDHTWYGAVRNITIKESTLYNIMDNSKNRVIRFQNKDLGKIFSTATGSCTLTDNTFVKTMSDKEFGNNTPNAASYTITFNNNICYDTWRLQKFIQGNNTLNVNIATNTVWGIKNKVDDTDKTRCATEEDAFGCNDNADKLNSMLKPLDLNAPNGGVDFKPSGAISSTIGDPRWLQ